ncbi:MAG: endo-1,4-beta-xylanase [Proteobacteria bacterium]|nr:endo-1,4-beta-xylanase [Pseudomonadota bacterium]
MIDSIFELDLKRYKLPSSLSWGSVLFLLIAISTCAARTGSGALDKSDSDVRFKDLAKAKKLRVGTAIRIDPFKSDQLYREKIVQHYGLISPEHAMKMDATHPEKDRYDYAAADPFFDFATSNGLGIHAHVLAWHEQLPAWVKDESLNSDKLKQIFVTYIKTVVGHFRDKYPEKVAYWDVVNEAVCEMDETTCGRDGIRESVWNRIGPNPWDYIPIAFAAAREADPHAKLLYNDYNLVWGGAKADKVYALVKALVDSGVAIDGVGFQMHVGTAAFDPKVLKRQFLRYEELGLEVQITEMDVRINIDDGISEDEVKIQNLNYANALRVCTEVASCKAFSTWGFSDKYSWIPEYFLSHGSALPFDQDMKPKPAYWSMVDVLRQ